MARREPRPPGFITGVAGEVFFFGDETVVRWELAGIDGFLVNADDGRDVRLGPLP